VRPTALTLLGLFLAGSGLASGAEGGLAPIRLHYQRGPGAESCPDEDQLREAIATRLGSDPFSDNGKRLLEITIGGQGEGLEAHIGLVGETGATSGQRDLVSKSRECHDLATVLVLTASMVLDPLPPPAPDSPPETPKTPTPPAQPHVAEAVATPLTSPVESAPSATGLGVGFAVSGAVGAVPSPSLGLALELGYAWTLFSLALDAQAILPAHQELSTGSVASSQFTAVLVPCVTHWHLGACGLISAGATRVAASGIEPAGSHSLPFFGLGGRVYGGLPLLGWLEARLQLDVLAPLTQTSIVLDGRTTWTAPAVSGSAGLALVARFR
jgi:hypothetical protein